MVTRWVNALKKIEPYVFEVSTPQGFGSGFQLHYSKHKGFCAIATAYHVIKHAYDWEEPIRVTHFQSKQSLLLKTPSDRSVLIYPDKDLALLLFSKGGLPIEVSDPDLIPPAKRLMEGMEIGWCGFPSIAPRLSLCFFEGFVSNFLASKESYLVDGVAINGVSGGPAFHILDSEGSPVIAGVVTEYRPNISLGTALPGLCLVVSVESYQKDVATLKSLDEAKEKAEKQKTGKDDE